MNSCYITYYLRKTTKRYARLNHQFQGMNKYILTELFTIINEKYFTILKKQRVYGITTATVKIGYEYSDCDLVWNIQSTKLSGHDMTSSDIDGWNLNVQHKYNYHAGILQKGDGNTVYLKYKPQVITIK